MKGATRPWMVERRASLSYCQWPGIVWGWRPAVSPIVATVQEQRSVVVRKIITWCMLPGRRSRRASRSGTSELVKLTGACVVA